MTNPQSPAAAPTAGITRRHVLAAAGGTAVAGRASPSRPASAYTAACVQTRVLPTTGPEGVDLTARAANLDTIVNAIEKGAAEFGARLMVFSEFCLQLSRGVAPVGAWVESAIDIPGPETDRIAKAAQAARAVVVFNPVERIAAFPGRYFLSGVVIGPSGDILANGRKLYDMSNKTRPSDILDQWLDKFGPRSLYPVADTEIGRIGSAVAMDVNWPEMVRGLVFAGAEIIANPTASPIAAPGYTVADAGPGPDIRTMARRVRAFENLAYMLTCNLGPVGSDPRAPLTPMLPSEIVDYRGRALATARDSAEAFITATIDIDALRQARCVPDPLNGLAQLQCDVHAPAYRDAAFSRANAFAEKPIATVDEARQVLRADIQALVRRGVFKAPAAP